MPLVARLQRMNIGPHFRAYTLRGAGFAAPFDPFLGVDHAWDSAATFPPHPHAGFSAVSYVFLDSETGIDNRDSLGKRSLIQPGGLHWTAAGRGVVHEEVPAETGKTVHMLQIFVNLPLARQGDAPFALSLAAHDVPVAHRPGVKIRVPLGGFGDTRSPLTPPTDVTLLEICLDDGAGLTVPLEAGRVAFFMPIHGVVTLDGERLDSSELDVPVFAAQDAERVIRVEARQGPAKLVLFGGTPLYQPVFWNGPMALASAEALEAATQAFQRGEFGRV